MDNFEENADIGNNFELEFEEGHEGELRRLKMTLRNIQLMDLPMNQRRKSVPTIIGTNIPVIPCKHEKQSATEGD